MQLAAVVLALVVAGAVVGGAAVMGAPVLAVPLLAVVLLGWAAWRFTRRALGREPRTPEPIRFGAEDRRTLAPSPSPAERRRNRERAARRL